ncbi:alpha-L-arabinofuranosidase C-terminal domain-containing protein [Sphingomonas sp. 7/4-4]|uniref:alpha-N-arabinofuranosidase n=1 Tax=Sphingomonas sp. 7/4-4 TaxID=3018446 RepID=UPI0022F3E09F|nr:alpha-L-arabinofuranosidase C-terminal domain-containing protein [Sphingomonas sp. 7/4-4]WBY09540.1 alpha-L-arabinofuranosidase C-terminal domain-containing protein [Sphingomonas sp. 7/4-4]
MKLLKYGLLPIAATLMATPALAQAPASVTVTVDTGKPGAKIEPAVYGQFAEHLGRGIYEGLWVGTDSKIPNTNGYRNDVLAALRHLKVPVVRWPGGCFADEYDWRDGIGPSAKRPVRINRHWGGVTEDNAFGTHEFMNYSEMLGTDAYVAGNMGSMSPRDMSQWMEYMTAEKGSLAEERKKNGREKPWAVKYFGVGNETWGCGGSMRPEYSADLHRRYQEFVNPPAGKKLIKVASGSNGSDYNFTDVMMREAGNKMNALSVHYYTLPTGKWDKKGAATGFSEDEWASTLGRAIFMDELITKHEAMMDKHDPEKKVALYVDEWGTWYDQESGSTPGFLYQQSSLRDAEVAALTLNIFHRHTDRVKMANIAQMINVLQAMILTDKGRMLLTPTYHVFDMYVPFQGATPYPADVKGPTYEKAGFKLPMVDVSAARGADGKLYLSLTNTDPNKAARVTTNLSGNARGRILTAPAIDTHNTFDQPNTIQPAVYSARSSGGKLTFDLPAKSIVVVAVE